MTSFFINNFIAIVFVVMGIILMILLEVIFRLKASKQRGDSYRANISYPAMAASPYFKDKTVIEVYNYAEHYLLVDGVRCDVSIPPALDAEIRAAMVIDCLKKIVAQEEQETSAREVEWEQPTAIEVAQVKAKLESVRPKPTIEWKG